jgi:flagellar hook-basal body complex protein FliE
MAIINTALKAYTNPLVTGRAQEKAAPREDGQVKSFGDTLKDSLKTVNDMQTEKSSMIKEFAAGENQNVHELMITMQKAGLSMQMTSAIRNKVMESYKEIMHMHF